MGCDRCGRCCKELVFPLGGDAEWMRKLTEFLEFTRPEVFGGVPGGLRIRVNCQHLDAAGACLIYDQRPEICRDFLCRKAKQGDPDATERA